MARGPALIFLALLAGSRAAEAADLRNVITDYSITSWSEKDGLPSVNVSAVAQDREGYLWVGTNEGLFRFDGVRFLAWGDLGQTPLVHTAVAALHLARDGGLWVGFSARGGVSRIVGGAAATYNEVDGAFEGPITAFAEDGDGTLWAAGPQGLFRFGADRWLSTSAELGLPRGPVQAFHVDRSGRLFAGMTGGLYEKAPEAARFALAHKLDSYPRSIEETAAGNICVTDQIVGANCLGHSPRLEDTDERGRGRRLLFDSHHNLWIGTAGQGLWRVRHRPTDDDEVSRATALTGLLADGVNALLEDREGNIWAGTTEGLNRLTPHRVTQMNLGVVAGVETTSDGTIWVATVNEVLRFTPDERAAGPPLRLPGDHVAAIHADREGTIWAASDQGLARLAPGETTFSMLAGTATLRRIDLITSDGGGGVWLYDLDRGLLRWRRDGRLSPGPALGGARARVLAAYTDSARHVWLAFQGGQVARLDKTGAHQLYDKSDGLDGGAYRAIYEGHDGAIWLAGIEGLSRYINGHFTTVRSGTRFPPRSLTAFVEDRDHGLWVGSASGITHSPAGEFERLAADRSYESQDRHFDRADGLAGLPFAYSNSRRAVQAVDGRVWFVTGRGLTLLDPTALLHEGAPQPVRIEGVVADHQYRPAAPDAVLPPRTSRLEINYTLLNLTSPLKTRFRYRLEGADTDWIEAGNARQAFYMNLPPGDYRFRVLASNRGATWSEKAAVWSFSIQPVFYRTSWFLTLCISLLALGLWASWRVRMGQVRQRFTLLLGERARLSREIHDTLLQGLVGVSLQCDSLSDEFAAGSPGRQRVVRMRKQVEEYIRDARQSIWDLRSPRLEARDLVAALQATSEHAVVGRDVRLTFKVEGRPRRQPRRDEEQLLRIGQEAVLNAVRHAQSSNLAVTLRYDAASISLEVADDGRGFDPKAQRPEDRDHYGLRGMAERAREVSGRLEIRSAPGSGTAIQVMVPVQAEPSPEELS